MAFEIVFVPFFALFDADPTFRNASYANSTIGSATKIPVKLKCECANVFVSTTVDDEV